MAGYFELYKDAGGKFRFRLKAGIDAVKRAADGSTIKDLTSS